MTLKTLLKVLLINMLQNVTQLRKVNNHHVGKYTKTA